LLDCFALLNAIFQQLNRFVLESFRHQSMFVKEYFQAKSRERYRVCDRFVIKQGGGHQGLMHLLPCHLCNLVGATFHVGERVALLLKNEH
jgi:hypothetical protein